MLDVRRQFIEPGSLLLLYRSSSLVLSTLPTEPLSPRLFLLLSLKYVPLIQTLPSPAPDLPTLPILHLLYLDTQITSTHFFFFFLSFLSKTEIIIKTTLPAFKSSRLKQKSQGWFLPLLPSHYLQPSNKTAYLDHYNSILFLFSILP